MGTGHGHGTTGRDAPASTRVRRLLAFALAPFALATLVGLVLLWPDAPRARGDGLGVAERTVRGTVERVEEVPCGAEAEPEDGRGRVRCAEATIRLTSGEDSGGTVRIDVVESEGSIVVREGAGLVLADEPSAPPELRYRVADVQRDVPLRWLALLFVFAVVSLGRWRGVTALVGLAVSLGVLVKFVLPALLAGASPLPIAVVGSAAIMFVAVFLAHGLTVRTSVAVLGTLVSLLLTGVLAAVFVAAGRFTGLATEEAAFLQALYGEVDVHGLLLAGIIIGSLGVLDDVTVTQASAVWELRAANPLASARDLYRSGLRIGRDHIASTVNTLVLAYAGAALPLLLLFSVAGRSVGSAVTSEVVAQEVVRTLVGSIGLVASVPVTTALAAFVATRGGARREGAEDETDSWIADLRDSWHGGDGERPPP